MKTLVLSHADVDQLLPMDQCIDLMARALSDLARGLAHVPQRMVVNPPGAHGIMGLMPAYLSGSEPAYGVKAVCVFPGNAALGKDIHQGVVALYSTETGEIEAIINASAITAVRTAAVSGLATRTLARPDAGVLGIIGAGVQGEKHLEAVACVRSIREVRIADLDPERARRLAEALRSNNSFSVQAVETAEQAVRGSDIIVTVTTAKDPVVRRDWVGKGAHINAIGACTPQVREIDTATMAEASLFVDRREATFAESGDYLLAAAEGRIGPESIRGELGEVLIGAVAGRTAEDEITLFEGLGLAIEDLACARFLHEKASGAGAGIWIDF